MEWRYVPFSSLFEWCKKSNIGSLQGGSEGKYKLFTASATEIKRYDEYLEDGEALVFGTGGNPCIHYVNGKFAYTNHCEAAKGKEIINIKFYYYYFQKNRYEQLRSTFVGGGIKNSSKKKIGELLVPVVSIEEQNQIVSAIEDYFSQIEEGIDNLMLIEKQLFVYKEAVLKSAFAFDDSIVQKPILDLCEYIVDCPHSTPKWTESGKLCLRTTNFKRGYLDLSEKNFVSEDTYIERIRRLKPESGDVLYSREGAILGIACMIPEGLEICMGQRMMLLRPKEELNNKFLMHYLNSPIAKELVVCNVGGSASPHINVGDIKKFPIPSISIDEQETIVAGIESRLSVCDSLEKTIKHTMLQAEALRQSVLKKAFEGGLV